MSVQEMANSEEISGLLQMSTTGSFSKLCQGVSPHLLLVSKRKLNQEIINAHYYQCILGNSIFKSCKTSRYEFKDAQYVRLAAWGTENRLKIRHTCPVLPFVNESQSRKYKQSLKPFLGGEIILPLKIYTILSYYWLLQISGNHMRDFSCPVVAVEQGSPSRATPPPGPGLYGPE